jgi:uncharacterized alkaline shock family protein YloU
VVTETSPDQWSGRVIDAVAHTADEVAALVLSVPGVIRLHGGVVGEAATYLPGRRVTGIKLGDDRVEVHVVVANGTPIRDTAQQIHTAVAAVVAAPVHVFVEDVDAG